MPFKIRTADEHTRQQRFDKALKEFDQCWDSIKVPVGTLVEDSITGGHIMTTQGWKPLNDDELYSRRMQYKMNRLETKVAELEKAKALRHKVDALMQWWLIMLTMFLFFLL